MYILVVIFSTAISVCGIWYISPISTSNFYATASLEEGKQDEEAGKKRKGDGEDNNFICHFSIYPFLC